MVTMSVMFLKITDKKVYNMNMKKIISLSKLSGPK